MGTVALVRPLLGKQNASPGASLLIQLPAEMLRQQNVVSQGLGVLKHMADEDAGLCLAQPQPLQSSGEHLSLSLLVMPWLLSGVLEDRRVSLSVSLSLFFLVYLSLS